MEIKAEKNGRYIDLYCRKILDYFEKSPVLDQRFTFYRLIFIHNDLCSDLDCPCHKALFSYNVTNENFVNSEEKEGVIKDGVQNIKADKFNSANKKSKKIDAVLIVRRFSRKKRFNINHISINNLIEYIYLSKCIEVDENVILLKNAVMYLYTLRKKYIKGFIMLSIYRDNLKTIGKTLSLIDEFILSHIRVILYHILSDKIKKHSEIKYGYTMIKALKYHENVLKIKTSLIGFSNNIAMFYRTFLIYVLKFSELKSLSLSLVMQKQKIYTLFNEAFNQFNLNKECLIFFYIFQKWILFEDLQKTNIDECMKKVQESINVQKNDIEKSINEYSNLESSSHIIVLKVKNEKFEIAYVSHNCLNMFEVMQEDDLLDKSINSFMPNNIAKVHDQFLNDYLRKPTNVILADNNFEVPIITAKLNLLEGFLSRVLDYSDTLSLFICGMMILKPQKLPTILCRMDGIL